MMYSVILGYYLLYYGCVIAYSYNSNLKKDKKCVKDTK